MKCDKLQQVENPIEWGLYYDKNEVDAAIDELKREHHRERHEYIDWVNRLQKENAELKEVYKDSVDVKVKIWERYKKAEEELRKTQRALWLARANDASSFAGLFSTLSDIEDDESRTYWIFGNKRKIVIDGLKCSRMETAYKWFCIWDNVANKCLKKAKEYK